MSDETLGQEVQSRATQAFKADKEVKAFMLGHLRSLGAVKTELNILRNLPDGLPPKLLGASVLEASDVTIDAESIDRRDFLN